MDLIKILLLPMFVGLIAIILILPQHADAGGLPMTNLVGEWNFQNNVLDTSGNNNNGINSGATFVTGKIVRALSFDGVNDVVTVPNNPTLNFGTSGSFSISLWMKSTQSGSGNAGFGWLVDHRRNNDGVYQGYTIGDSSGIIQARIRDGAANDVPVVSTTNVNDGNFHHVVFVVDRSSQTEQLYIDNSLQASANISSVGSINTSFDVYLGGTASPDTLVNFFAGTMDQTRIYNRALSTSEIQNLFNEGNNQRKCITPPSNLVGWWPGDGNTNDLAGSHKGTISGGVTFAPGKVLQAFSFDGTGSVGVGSLGISSDTQPFSIIAWINPSSSAISDGLPHTIVGEGSTPNLSGNGEYFSYISLTGSGGLGKLQVEIGATQTYSDLQTTAAVVPPNQWSLVSVTYDGSRTPGGIKIYFNGVEQPATSSGSGFTLAGSPRDQWVIGSEFGVYDTFSGLVDETEIFNTVVAPQVIQSEFSADSAGKCKSNAVIATIPVGTTPDGIAFDSINDKLYVSNAGSNSVSVINGATDAVVKTIHVSNGPTDIAFDSANGNLYVSEETSGTVTVINGTSNKVIGSPIPIGGSPTGIAFDSVNGNLYVSAEASDSVTVINGATNTVIGSPITVGSTPVKVEFDASNGDVYVSNFGSNSVSVINGATNTVVNTISLSSPYGLATDYANGNVYVDNIISNSVSIINGATNTVVDSPIPVGNGPVGIAFDSANGKLYATDENSASVSVIKGATNTVVGNPIPVGNGSFAVTFDYANKNIYLTNADDGTVSVIKPGN